MNIPGKNRVFPLTGLWLLILSVIPFSCTSTVDHPVPSSHDLVFTSLAARWDDAIPLGNGWLGELVWQKDTMLRFSLDRSDLWDLRPLKNLEDTSVTYQWVYQNWKNGHYDRVHKVLDIPYDQRPAPTKIPAGALEFDTRSLGKVTSVRLYVREGICEVRWSSGASLQTFVQADAPAGWFRFTGVNEEILPQLISPPYQKKEDFQGNKVIDGQDLRRLGYPAGKISRQEHAIAFEQEGWGGFHYRIHVQWQKKNSTVTGAWSVSAHYPGKPQPTAEENVAQAFKTGFDKALDDHKKWWRDYWSASAVHIPDTVLEKQYYLDMYKFGAAARAQTPPISLQAVWTADNGRLPPWKGDFHHDLNTQLSYWPAYAGNHLKEEEGFLNWLWEYKPVFERFTRRYFHTEGLNVPGVTTLTGEPMGGWIQYSLGPTVAAWLGQHFYLHWKYSMDTAFLKQRAYPWLAAVGTYLEQVSVTGADGKRKLPISSSPEIFDNSEKAWFPQTTNFDLALIRFTYEKAAETAAILGKKEETRRWRNDLAQWPALTVDPKLGLLVAPGQPLPFSHRHFSHLMAIHPLGLIDWSRGEQDRTVIRHSLHMLDSLGTDWWVGYSFAWLGNLRARARDGAGAAEALRIFATAFCLPNSFHVNGDQSGKGYSKFRYRPFTLEGNFASAAGIQEMLLQSYTDTLRVFPAIPPEWKEASFDKLRAQGAFLVSAVLENREVSRVEIFPEKGGTLWLADPFRGQDFRMQGAVRQPEKETPGIFCFQTKKGTPVILAVE